MKLKLIIVDAFDLERYIPSLEYYITEGHIDRWVYSTPNSSRHTESIFK